MPNGRTQGGPRTPGRDQGRHQGGGRQGPPQVDTSRIDIRTPLPELFDGVAREAAQTVSEERHRNKPSQLRKFFDELVMWETKVNGGSLQDEEGRKARFEDALPFIRMLNAKAAYAEGRKLVDRNFQRLLEHCLAQVEDARTLRNCRLFFEAFLGFYKALRPSDN